MYRPAAQHRIIEDIARLGLRAGDLLPGEHRLCEQFGVSRTVVRQALAQLEHAGRRSSASRARARSWRTRRRPESLVHTLTGLFEEVAARGGHVHSEVRRQEVSVADDEVAEALRDRAGRSPVVVIERLRHVDGEPWSLSTTTFLPHGIGVSCSMPTSGPVALCAARRARHPGGSRACVRRRPSRPTSEQGRLLGVGEGQALLVLRSVGYDEDDRPMEFFVAYHRGDRSRFEFQLSASPDVASRGVAAAHRA